MLHMIVREARNGVVAVIVAGLVADHQISIVAGFLGRGGEVLGEELRGLVEGVGCALFWGG